MSFVRAKEIPPRSGNWYDYEVKGVRVGKHVRQKVIRYLGRSGQHSYLTGNHEVLTSITEPKIEDARITKMKTSSRKIASALGMYYGGMSLDAIQQQFKQDHGLDMSESNYWNWVKRFTEEAVKQCKDFKPEVGDEWVADETYMKLGKRNVYFWDIICPKTNYLLASHVSFYRTAREAKTLLKLASERAGKTPKAIITDKLASYIQAVEDSFGSETKHVRGGPFKAAESGESTAEIERFHKTLEQRTEVFEKFKDIDSIRLLTQGWLINYNFFKQSEGCGNIPPAQAMSKVVPFKDWNDIVRPESVPDMDYKVSLSRRKSVKKGNPVFDATLTPVEASKEVVPNE